jgi:hypothetical protein
LEAAAGRLEAVARADGADEAGTVRHWIEGDGRVREGSGEGAADRISASQSLADVAAEAGSRREWCEQRPLGAAQAVERSSRVESRRGERCGWRTIQAEKGSCTDGREDGAFGTTSGGERDQVIDTTVTKSITGGKKRRREVSGRRRLLVGVRVVAIFMSPPHPPIRPASESLLVRLPREHQEPHAGARQGSERAGRRQGKPMRMQAAGFWAREKVGVGETSLGEVMAQ